MARIRNGILGGFSGKVGEVIGQNYQGVSTMRAMPKYVSNPKTQAQEEHRAKVSYLGKLLQPLAKVLNLSTYGGNKVNNGYNRAFRSNLHNVIINQGEVNVPDVNSLDFGTYVGLPFLGMDFNFALSQQKSYVDVTLDWNPVLYSPHCFYTDRPIMFLLQELEKDIYTTIYADLLECQRSWGHYEFTIYMPELFDMSTNFVLGFGYTLYATPAIVDPGNNRANEKKLRAIDWSQYSTYLMHRYEYEQVKQLKQKYDVHEYNSVPREIIMIPSS